MSTYNLDKTTVLGGITLHEEGIRSNIKHHIDPVSRIDNESIDKMLFHESMARSSKEDVQMRQNLIKHPGLGNFKSARVGFEKDKRIDNATKTIKVDQTREREYSEIPISPLIHLFAWATASDPQARKSSQIAAQHVPFVPSLICETHRKIRISVNGPHGITPSLDTNRYISVLVELGLGKSMFAISELRTVEGCIKVLSFFYDILVQRPQYFATENSKSLQSISFHAGEQTTFCSLNTNGNMIQVAQHNSYPMGTPTAVNIVDAIVCNVKHTDDNYTPIVITASKAIIASNVNSDSISAYIVHRALGIESNQSGIREDLLGKEVWGKNPDMLPPRQRPQSQRKPQREWKSRSVVKETAQKENPSLDKMSFKQLKCLATDLVNKLSRYIHTDDATDTTVDYAYT